MQSAEISATQIISEFLDSPANNPGLVHETDAMRYVINDIYQGLESPNLTEYQNNQRSVDSLITIYSDALTNVLPLLNVDFETIDAIESVDAQTTNNPTENTRFATYFFDRNGDFRIDKNNLPSMNLDEDIANANKNNMKSAERAALNYKREVMSKLVKINENIDIIENALVGNNGAGGLEGTASEYASLINKISASYKTEYKFSREMLGWARAVKINHENSPRGLWLTHLDAKSRNVYDANNTAFGPLLDLAKSRLEIMNTLLGKSLEEIADLNAEEEVDWWDYHRRRTREEFRVWVTNRTTYLGVQLWNNVPNEGLEGVIEQSLAKIRSNHSENIGTMENMGTVQAEFTTKLNRLYYALADLSETKYDILTKVISWEEREPTPNRLQVGVNKPQSNLNILRGMKEDLTAKMEVPEITHLYAMNYDKGIYAEVQTAWRVQGQNGNKTKFIIDYSSQNPTISSSGYQSVGGAQHITLYYTPLPGQSTFGRTSLRLKARNQVGYTIHRSLDFTPTFTNRGTERIGAGTYFNTETDDTPPILNPLFLPWNYNLRVIAGNPINYMMFTDDSSRIEAEWSARDPQSGIQEYRYRFIQVRNPESPDPEGGLSINTENLAAIRNINNGEDDGPYADWISNLGRNNIVLNTLDLQHNRVYQLQVVAKNGDGLWSETIAGELQYYYSDLTPPTKPTLPFTLEPNDIDIPDVDLGVGNYGYGGKPRNAVTYSVNPLLSANNLPTDVVAWNADYDNSDAQFELTWEEAEDPESGIFNYQVQATNMRDQSITSDWEWVNRNRTEYTFSNNINAFNEMFNYRDSFKVAVRAINYAKRASKSSERIIKIHDLTRPTKPDVAAVYHANGSINLAGLIFREPSVDFQSGIDHYEVAVGSEPNGEFDLLSWNDAILINSFNRFGRTNIRIPANNNVSYIAVRAVNRNGLKGRICYTGPFYQDNTPPERPEVTVSHYDRIDMNRILTLDFSNLRDEESGIRNVQYRFSKKEAGSSDWISVTYWHISTSLNGAAINLTQHGIGNNTDLMVRVRSMNNVELFSYGSQEYRLSDVSPPLEPTVTITIHSISKGEKGVELTFGNISDPESGVRAIEYKIDKTKPKNVFYESVTRWKSNGTNTTTGFMYSQYSLRTGQSIRVSVRTINNDGLVSIVQRTIKVLD